MSITLRTFFLLLLSSLLVVSCGRDEKSDDSPSVTKTPQNEIEGDEDTVNRNSRYSTIVLEENCGFWTDCDFIVRSDLNQRPVILTADFMDSGWVPDESAPSGEIDVGECHFQVTLTDSQADQLEALADKLRICSVRNSPGDDEGFDGLFTTNASGKEFLVYKHKNGGLEEEGDINYLCGGRSAFYNFIEKIIVPEAPAECPSGYKRLFR